MTSSKKVAKIGKHNIYKIKKFDMLPLFKTIGNDNKQNEIKYVQIFKEIQLTRGFYFSYTYDITHTLQDNIIH